MSRVIKINKINKTRNSIHQEVACTYCTFHSSDKRYFQIDTYVTKDAGANNQSSQKIQFDKIFALKLIDILKKEFDI